MANRRCKKLPGIDRDTKSTKIDFRPGSSALQYVSDKGGTVKQTNAANPAPTNFLGGIVKGIGNMAKGAIMGGDGKFNLKDVGRLALGPAGMAMGAARGAGMFKKDQSMVATPANKLGKKPCPGCVKMCPQCGSGRKSNSPTDKHCF